MAERLEMGVGERGERGGDEDAKVQSRREEMSSELLTKMADGTSLKPINSEIASSPARFLQGFRIFYCLK